MEKVEIYSLNSCIIQDFNKYVVIILSRDESYRFSTEEGKYRYTFTGKFLRKYKHLYYDNNKEDAEDVLMCFEIPSLL